MHLTELILLRMKISVHSHVFLCNYGTETGRGPRLEFYFKVTSKTRTGIGTFGREAEATCRRCGAQYSKARLASFFTFDQKQSNPTKLRIWNSRLAPHLSPRTLPPHVFSTGDPGCARIDKLPTLTYIAHGRTPADTFNYRGLYISPLRVSPLDLTANAYS